MTKKERSNIKRIVYGIIYGIGPRALAKTLKLGVENAQRIKREFLNKFPKIKKFLRDAGINAESAQEVVFVTRERC